MKKSELKEIIKSAMMAEGPIKEEEEFVGNDINANKLLKIFAEYLPFNHYHQDKTLSYDEALDIATEFVKFTGMDSTGADFLNHIADTEGPIREAEDVEVEDNEEVDVDIEKDVEIDDESVESDIEVKGSMPGEDADEVAVQSLLMKAQEEAAKLGDEKLTDQIGNTITYFTRAHVATVDEAKNDIKETLVDADQDMAEAILNALGGEAAFEAVVRAMSTDDAQIYLGGIIRDYSIGMEDEAEEIDEIAAMPGEEGVEDVNIDNPAEDAMVGLTESLRWQRIAGIAKDNGLYSK